MKKQHVRGVLATLFGASLLGLVCVGVWADEKPTKLQNLPSAVRQTVEEQSRGATLRGVSKETVAGKTFYEAELTVNGHNKDVLIDETGAVVEVEEEIALDALPPAVKVGIEKQAGKRKIIMVESITKNGALVAYEAHIKSGIRTKEVKVSPDGAVIKE